MWRSGGIEFEAVRGGAVPGAVPAVERCRFAGGLDACPAHLRKSCKSKSFLSNAAADNHEHEPTTLKSLTSDAPPTLAGTCTEQDQTAEGKSRDEAKHTKTTATWSNWPPPVSVSPFR